MLHLSDIPNWETIALFKNLEKDYLQTILDHSSVKELQANQTLISQEDSTEQIYIILEGTLKTSRVDKDGDEATLRLFKPQEICLDAAVFADGPSTINIQSTKKSKILAISNKFLYEQVPTNRQLALNFLKIVTKQYKNAIYQIDAISIKSPVHRVGYYLLLKYFELANKRLDFEIPFKKQTIANHLNMTPETFSRTLKHLKTMGVNIQNGRVSLDNRKVLCSFCDSDTAELCAKYKNGKCHINSPSKKVI